MRDYLSPAKRVMERVVPQPDATRLFLSKHHASLFIITALVVVIMTLGIMTLRMTGVFGASTQRSVITEGKTSTLTTTTPSNAPNQPSTIVNQQTVSQSTSSSPDKKSETSTNVTVNNQSIDVPVNGTTHKTVTNSDGSTTDVTVSNNSQSDTDGSTSTSVTTNTNTNTTQSLHTSSNSMSIERTSQ